MTQATQDPRRWVEQGSSLHVRVPHGDYRTGRTVAWARRDPANPDQWEVRILDGPDAGRWSVATRTRARHILEQQTAHHATGTEVQPVGRRDAWTPDQEQRLLTMVAAHIPHADIAATLGRTPVAVENRLKILRRQSAGRS